MDIAQLKARKALLEEQLTRDVRDYVAEFERDTDVVVRTVVATWHNGELKPVRVELDFAL